VVVDGVEPMDAPADSIQLFVFDELYRKTIHRDAETLGMEICLPVWKHRAFIDAHRYDHARITTLLLVTTEETRLEDLLARPVAPSDLLRRDELPLRDERLRSVEGVGQREVRVPERVLEPQPFLQREPEPADAGFLVGAERRLRVLADPFGELRAFVQEPGALDDAAHEVDAIRFFRVEPPPGDQEIERHAEADDVRQPLGQSRLGADVPA